VCSLHSSLDSFSSRYYGALHGLLTSLFPDYHLLAWGYCPLSLSFCLARRTFKGRKLFKVRLGTKLCQPIFVIFGRIGALSTFYERSNSGVIFIKSLRPGTLGTLKDDWSVFVQFDFRKLFLTIKQDFQELHM
jgi:hypothetical protein